VNEDKTNPDQTEKFFDFGDDNDFFDFVAFSWRRDDVRPVALRDA
jgi:hypothetical protein